MRLPRMTTRQLMLAVAIVALVLSPGVVGKGPDESRPLDWALAMALANVPPILILPVLFRLDRLRGSLVIAATAGIAAAQVALRAPPNLYAVDGYMAIAAMARLARDIRDLISAITAVACGLLAGVACGYNPCTPIEIVVAPLTGILIRIAFRPRTFNLGQRTCRGSPDVEHP